MAALTGSDLVKVPTEPRRCRPRYVSVPPSSRHVKAVYNNLRRRNISVSLNSGARSCMQRRPPRKVQPGTLTDKMKTVDIVATSNTEVPGLYPAAVLDKPELVLYNCMWTIYVACPKAYSLHLHGVRPPIMSSIRERTRSLAVNP